MRRNKSSSFVLPKLLVLVSFLIISFTSSPAQATQKIVGFYSIADSYVLSTSHDSNFGSSLSLFVATQDDAEFSAFLMFDLSQIPSGASIDWAKLWLFANVASKGVLVSSYYCPENDWTEEGITYENSPSFSDAPVDAVNVTKSDYWYSWNVTNALRSYEANNKRVTFKLQADSSGWAWFRSREVSSLEPSLGVAYSTPDAPEIPWILINPVVIKLATIWLIGGALAIGLGYVIYQITRPTKPLPSVPRSWRKERQCPKCGRKLPQDEEYCSVCAPKVEVTEIVRPKPVKSWFLNFGRILAFATGFVSLFAGITNFALSAQVASNLANIDAPEVAGYFNLLIVMFFASALLCLVGHGLGWSLGLNPWEVGHRKTIVIEITFLACLGFVNLVEGVIIQGSIAWRPSMFWGPTGVGSVMIWLVAFPMAVLAIASLSLTTLIEKDQQDAVG